MRAASAVAPSADAKAKSAETSNHFFGLGKTAKTKKASLGTTGMNASMNVKNAATGKYHFLVEDALMRATHFKINCTSLTLHHFSKKYFRIRSGKGKRPVTANILIAINALVFVILDG